MNAVDVQLPGFLAWLAKDAKGYRGAGFADWQLASNLLISSKGQEEINSMFS